MMKESKTKEQLSSRVDESDQPGDPAFAQQQAEKDILGDPELSDPDPTDDLDEGELARRDNSDEKAADSYSKKS